jgi:hypothetical protein
MTVLATERGFPVRTSTSSSSSSTPTVRIAEVCLKHLYGDAAAHRSNH